MCMCNFLGCLEIREFKNDNDLENVNKILESKTENWKLLSVGFEYSKDTYKGEYRIISIIIYILGRFPMSPE